jgi:predicted acetylornithine/succinylornithine family transaminase
MVSSELIGLSETYLMHTYKRLPVTPISGKGLEVTTLDNKTYLDFLSGIAVNCLGHCHPNVVNAIIEQAHKLLHVSNLYHIEPQTLLAKLLVEHSFADKAFFCNSGTEANEAAIKLARLYSRTHYGADRFEIIATLGSFHGRTMASLSACGQKKFQIGFEPLLPGFKHVPFSDIEALKAAMSAQTCAVMLEPIQGEFGVVMPKPGYLKEVRQLCDDHAALLIFDEVQTGIGRTGKLFAYEHFDAIPDIMTLAKSLGGGVAIGAMLSSNKVAEVFKPGTHAATYGGNFLACAASLAVLQTLLSDNGKLLAHCQNVGLYFKRQLETLALEFPQLVAEVRGLGLMLAIQLNQDCSPIVHFCLDHGLLVNCTNEKVLRFLPPYIVTEQQIDRLIDTLRMAFKRETQ